MNKKITFAFLIFSAFCCLKTFAQKENKPFSFGIAAEVGVPTGATSDYYNFTGGLTIRGSLHEGPGFITLTTGGIGYFPKAINSSGKASLEIPVRAGYKYIMMHHFFLMGELGYAHFTSYYDAGNNTVGSVGSSSFIAAPSFGVQFKSFEVGIRYGIVFSSGGGGDLALRIGFNF